MSLSPMGMLTTVLLSAFLSGLSTFLFCRYYLYQYKLRRIRHRLLVMERREDFFRKLVEHSGDLITIHDIDGVYLYASPVSTKLIGYTPDELLGRSVFDFIHKEDGQQFKLNLYRLLKKEHVQMSFRIRVQHGEYIWLETMLTGVLDQQGKLQEVIAVSRNITQRKLDELALKESKAHLEYLSITDAVTGIANRRYFEEYLAKEWQKAISTASPFSILFVDIDCFKSFNDTYGHQLGDQALQMVAEKLSESIQVSPHLVARYGGEEFIVVCPNLDKQSAIQKAELLRAQIEAMQIPHETSTVAPILTVSVGVSTISTATSNDSTNLLIAKADKALYEAKQAGRNQVRFNG